MPLATTTAQDAALDAVVASFPAGTYRLFIDAPPLGGAELTSDGGYAPVAHASTDWAAASGGVVSTTAPVNLGTSTDAYSDVATVWAVCDSLGAVWYWDYLTDPISVTVSGTAVTFTPSIYFQDNV